ncbi:two-partner secretion domain-containing protein [Massilia genomosp. 1]|uniref:Filamentous hemagglutinin N-terminal domain-containing protein n=1 Tax=Massilia genomosp. 1 TaxID=2609280 RepID=A0ABX0MQ97_9BURK|nr:filamentous hemagglutinin N-terminal domain-containing protein [Massilia genomosp. 1]NHZ62668.1 filamentous hemagglutinin N-terminal domain-containing protein [Massilia genomosp. 1]
MKTTTNTTNTPTGPALRLLCACLLLATGLARGAPQSPHVVAGQASFGQQGNVFSITNTPNTIIQWQSFSVNAGDITRFIQQDGNSAVLNRIVGQDPSRILGALQSNGQVFLINPNGVLFGRDARIDVNGLTASSLNLSNADFLAGKRNFSAAAGAAPVRNEGSISTPSGGHVFLIAPNVENSGVIHSPQGEVVLAAGHSVQLVDSRNPDLHVVVAAPASEALNLGRIVAEGGKVGIYGALVRQRGALSADSARVGEHGQIVFKASADALLEAGSVTSARGGSLSVQGERVGMTGDARIEAAGGSVLLGGGWQGKNALVRNARQTVMGKNAVIEADGGTVVLWSDGATRANGRITARGGQVETSGRQLDVHGVRVEAGGWLLDPYDVTIGINGSTVLPDAVDDFADGMPGTGVTLLDVAMLNSAAPATAIKVQATHDVLVDGAITRPAGSAGSLTIDAGNHITINAPVSTSGGALTLNANASPYASGSGGVFVNSAVDTGGGAVSMSGDSVHIGAGGSAVVNSGSGSMGFVASKQFTLSSNSSLQGSAAIAILSDQVSMPGGMIGPAGSVRPVVSIAPLTPGRPIEIASGGPSQSILRLSPFDLNPIHASDLIIGGDSYEGVISVNGQLGGASTPLETQALSLRSGGTISVMAPLIMLPGTGSVLTLARHGYADAAVLTNANGMLSADHIAIHSDAMTLGGLITSTGAVGGSVTLAPHDGATLIHAGANALDGPGQLGLSDSELKLVTADKLIIGGQANQTGALDVTGLLDMSGNLTAGSKLALIAGAGKLTLHDAVITPGSLYLSGSSIANTSTAPARASAIGLSARGQIGSSGATPSPFYTQTSALTADNATDGGTSDIDISNTGTLSLGSVTQTGPANVSPITVANKGGMTVMGGGQGVRSNGGAITLTTASPLTIDGSVASNGGALALTAGNGGTLTVGPTGSVASGAGNMSLQGGAIINNGSLSATSGNITLSAPTVSGSGTATSVSGTVTGTGPGIPATPTVESCIATPSQSACAGILAQAFQGCLANPAIAYCASLLPSLGTCVSKPATAGCSVVLPSLAQCEAAPSTAGCGAVLPNLAQCLAAPATAGCAAVLPSLATCGAAPATPGCAVVLPSLAVCTSAPATAGCAAVLPTLSACIAAPATAGCSAVLPSLAACVANPAASGCGAVLPSLAQCVSTPSLAGCGAVLPTLAQCAVAPSQAGCSVVLPSLAQCVAAPSQAGCNAVLPTLAQCVAAPNQAGCAVVLPSLAQCVAVPTLPACASVLPTLSQCLAAPFQSGCAAVLPSLNQCVSAPALAGCSVVLPTLAQCVSRPGTAGCAVVLPGLNQCVANPAVPGCGVVLPGLANCTANPALAGCSAVLPSVSQCSATPTLAGCVAVLPSLPQCVATPSAPGCVAVLPSLGQCVATPAAAGCGVVLPTLAQCVGSPTLQGCTAVLPTVNACVANPAAPGCAVVTPPTALAASEAVTQAIQDSVYLINTATGQATLPGSTQAQAPLGKELAETQVAKAATGTTQGDASELRKKTYCN